MNCPYREALSPLVCFVVNITEKLDIKWNEKKTASAYRGKVHQNTCHFSIYEYILDFLALKISEQITQGFEKIFENMYMIQKLL
jgi:hypothetical protein